MRVVVDTSVLISALLWRGLPHRLLELAEVGAITLCASESTLAELHDVLGRPKFQLKLLARNVTLNTVMQGMISLIELYPNMPLPGAVPADPDDEIIVSCAIVSSAAYLISGDEHLLSIRQVRDTKIVTVRDFLDAEFPNSD